MHGLWWMLLWVQRECLVCLWMGLCISRQRLPVSPESEIDDVRARHVESPESSSMSDPTADRRKMKKKRLRGHHRAMSASSVARSRDLERMQQQQPRGDRRRGDDTPPAPVFRPRRTSLDDVPALELAQRSYLQMLLRVERAMMQEMELSEGGGGGSAFESPTVTVTRASDAYEV
jgi:hypothetical protein